MRLGTLNARRMCAKVVVRTRIWPGCLVLEREAAPSPSSLPKTPAGAKFIMPSVLATATPMAWHRLADASRGWYVGLASMHSPRQPRSRSNARVLDSLIGSLAAKSMKKPFSFWPRSTSTILS